MCRTQKIKKSKKTKTQKSQNPNIQKSKNQKIHKSKNQKKTMQDAVDVKSFGFLDFWIFRCLDFLIFGFLEGWVSACLYSGSLDLRISAHQELHFRVP